MELLLLTLGIGGAITVVAVLGVIVARAGTGPLEAPLEATGSPTAQPAPRPATPRDAPMVVTQMATRGFFAIEDASGRREEEPLPESPLGHGEFPMGLWAAPDQSVYVVGKLYTGRPGPDDGIVWRRSATGEWSVALRLPGRVIGHVSGRSESEVVVGLMGGIATFDGHSWTEHALPYSQMWKVFVDGADLVAQAFDGSAAYTVSLGLTSMASARAEPRVDRYSVVRDAVTYRIFDRSTPIGPRTLGPAEEAQIRRELAQVQAALARGEGTAPPRDAR